MKKLLFLFGLILITVIGNSQVIKQWKTSVTNSAAPASDTAIFYVLQSNRDKLDMSSAFWSVEARCVGFDANDATVTFGGSFYDLPVDSFQFQAFINDSLPYTLNLPVIQTITNSDTAYFKTFKGGNVKYGLRLPAYQYNKGSNTTGVLTLIYRFYE